MATKFAAERPSLYFVSLPAIRRPRFHLRQNNLLCRLRLPRERPARASFSPIQLPPREPLAGERPSSLLSPRFLKFACRTYFARIFSRSMLYSTLRANHLS